MEIRTIKKLMVLLHPMINITPKEIMEIRTIKKVMVLLHPIFKSRI
jgi:hypothetical protein